MSEPIRVWRFERAPEEWQNLSDHGGDEDWLVHIPKEYVGEYLPWCEPDMYVPGTIGVCSISVHPLPDGSEVRIGAHA